MTGPILSGLEIIFNKVCVLVTAAFALTLVPGFRRSERSIASVRNNETKLLVFLLLGFIEEAAVGKTGWFNHRIIAACAAGLLAGPGAGAIVAVFVTWMAVAYDGRPLEPVGISMLCGGLVGGWLYRWRPSLAQHPLTGFCLTAAVSCLRDGLIFLCAPEAMPGIQMFGQVGIAPILQGLGTALILTIVAIVRDRDKQMQAAASAEVSALQSRMNPHFLFNALNALAALSTVAPREVPRAAGRLRDFLRAMFDQPERTLISVEQELGAVRAYLDIVSLRLGRRLQVEEDIDPVFGGSSNATFFLSTAGRERGSTRCAILAQSRSPSPRRLSGPKMVGDKRQRRRAGCSLLRSRTSLLRGATARSCPLPVAKTIASIVWSLLSPGNPHRGWSGHHRQDAHSPSKATSPSSHRWEAYRSWRINGSRSRK
jgi:LytS/YehU family sensor histidine kinase